MSSVSNDDSSWWEQKNRRHFFGGLGGGAVGIVWGGKVHLSPDLFFLLDYLLIHGLNFSKLTEFPDFSSIFSIFPAFFNVLFFNWRLDPF